MKTAIARPGLVVALLGLTAAGAAAQRAPAAVDLQALDAYVARALQDWKIPGLAIAVVKDDRVVFAKGYGQREVGKTGAVDTGTRFAIGSTTKAMTAAALGMLVDEGKLRWDDPVIRHLPHFRLADPYVTRELTVRDLLTHRGGLGNADQLWLGTDYPTAEIIRRAATLEPAYSLRSRFIYQNVMYAVAGEVVAAVSGLSWAEFVRTRIFLPLGMSNTSATLAGVQGQPNVAAPHREIRDTIRPVANRSVDMVAAAGSVWSSVDDMAKWMRFMLDSARVNGRRLLTEATYREIVAPQVIAPVSMYPTLSMVKPRFFTYGLGWFLHDYDGTAAVMHTGSIDGMSALIGLLPDQRAGVYVLANLDHAELRHALMYHVFDLYNGTPTRDWSAQLLAYYKRAQEQAVAVQRRQEQSRAMDTRPSLPLDRFAGSYLNDTYGSAVVTMRDGALHFAFGRDYKGPLSHWQYDTFRVSWQGERQGNALISFTTDGAGQARTVRAFGLTFTRQ